MTRKDWIALGVFALALAAAFSGTWFTGRTFFARDLTYLFHPMHAFTAQALQSGEMPAWNPYVSGGVYWLGQPQTGVFSPGNLPFWIFPFVPGFKLFQALHFFLSGLGGYLWVRANRGARWAALSSALLWSLNGFWRARVEFPPLLNTLTWTPWALLFLGAKPGWTAGLGMALSLTFALLGGHWPHAAWMGAALLALWAASGGRGRGVVALSAGAGAAVLAAVQLFPGLDLLGQSTRVQSGVAPSVAGLHSLTVARWAGLLAPRFGDFPSDRYTGERFFWLGCFYIGALALWAAGRGFWRSSLRARGAWAALFALGALFSVGNATPVYAWAVNHVPGLRGVRFPAQYAYWMVISALALLAVAGGGDFRRRWLRWTAVGIVAAELMFWGAGLSPTLPGNYFQSRPSWISMVQSSPGKLFLTPRAADRMSAHGRTLEETWTLLRHRLLDLGTLPYRVANLNPSGFSLNPAGNDRALMALYAHPTPAAAEADLDRLDVQWVAAPEALEVSGWRLIRDDPWRLYERPRPSGEGAVLSGSGTAPWAKRRRGLGRDFWSGDAVESATLVTRDLWQKDWIAGNGRRRLEVFAREGVAAVRWDEPLNRFWMRFAPASFRWGILFALAGWTAALAIAFRRAGAVR
ncbi:MAG: hypothetical protein IPP68_07845 [Elusimicrobia bacterium]|nr:hypothetical protein [Elusimicrobiota bacterium]